MKSAYFPAVLDTNVCQINKCKNASDMGKKYIKKRGFFALFI